MNPYGISSLVYFDAGFSPLPALGKLLVVKGASGRHPIASREQVVKWSRTHGPFNVALRLPKNVIALDIDEYKGDLERLKKLEDELGELPITWNSDSRGGAGGKLLFSIPDELASDRWQSNISGITIAQHTHRYVMALPSMNKESKSRYQWYMGLNGQLVPDYQIPTVNDLSELPKEWASVLKKTVDPMYYENSGISNDDLDIFNPEEPCAYMQILTEMCSQRLLDAHDAGLHDTGLSVIGLLVTAATDGHSGIVQAIDTMSEIFISAPRGRDLGSEWNNLLSFVLANVEVDRISEVDTCKLTLVMKNKIRNDVAILLSAGLTASQIRQRLYRKR